MSGLPEEHDASVDDWDDELRDMASSLGICYETEGQKYGWYIEQCVKSQLPTGWVKESDPSGKFYYYHESNGEIVNNHPSIFQFRQFFFDHVEKGDFANSSNTAPHPHFQRNLTKEFSQGIKPSSTNLKSSKSPSKVSKKNFSKLRLDKADGKPSSPQKTKKAVGLLKETTSPTKQKLGNKPVASRTKNQVGELPSDPRISLVALQKKPSLLMETSFSKFSNPHLMNPSLADLEIGSPNEGMERSVSRQDTAGRSLPRGKFAPTPGWQEKMILWETSSELLTEATKYYKRFFGDLTTLPDSVRTSEEYISQDPVELIQHMQHLDIKASETHLYWIARLQLALPLPPEYTCIMTSAHSEALGEDGQHKMYLHKVHLLYLPVHPGTEFITDLIRKMRRVGVDYSKIKDFGKVQEFKDPFGVRCKVDLYLLRLAYDGELDLYEKYVQNNKQMLEELQIENGFKFKSVGKFEGSKSRIDGEDGLGEDGKQGLSRAALANIFKQTKGITDLLVLEVCRQAKIDLLTEPELLGLVTEFVMHPPEKFVLGSKGEDKNKLIPQKWESRCPDGKTFFWVNPAMKRAQAAYPYLTELHAAIDKQKRQVEAVASLGKYKRDASKLSFLFRQSDPEYVKKRVLDERTQIISRSVVKRGGKLDELRKELKNLNVDIDEHLREPVIGSSGPTSQMLSRQDSSEDSGHVSQIPSKLMSRKDSLASTDKRPTLQLPEGSNLQLPKRVKGLPRPSSFGLFMSQKKEKEKEQQERKKIQAAKQALKQLSNLLGGSKILDSKYQIAPHNLRPFMHENFKQLFTKEQVLDAVYYCFFDMTEKLDHMVRAKLKTKRLFERLYEEEEERIRKAVLEEKKRLVREERRIARELARIENNLPQNPELGVGEFLDRVKAQINRTKLLQAQCGDLSLNSDMVKNFMKMGPNFDKKYKDLKTAFEARKKRVVEELKKGTGGATVYKNKKRRTGSNPLDNGSDTELDNQKHDIAERKLNRSFNDIEDFEYESSEGLNSFQDPESQQDDKSEEDTIPEGSNSSDMLDSEEQDILSNRPAKGRKPTKLKVKIKQKNSKATFLTSTDGTKNRRESMLLDLPSRKKILEGLKADQSSKRMSMLINPGGSKKNNKLQNNLAPDQTKIKHQRNPSKASSINTKSGDTPHKAGKIKKPRFQKKDKLAASGSSEDDKDSSESESSNKLSDLFPSYKPSRKASEMSQDFVMVAGVTKKELIEDKKIRNELQNKQEQRVKLRDVLLDYVKTQSNTNNNKTEPLSHPESDGKIEGFSQRVDQVIEREKGRAKRHSILNVEPHSKNFQVPVTPQTHKSRVGPVSPFAHGLSPKEAKPSSDSLPRIPQAVTPPLKDAGSAITKVANVEPTPKPFSLLPSDVFDPTKNFFDIMDKLAATDLGEAEKSKKAHTLQQESDNTHWSELQIIKQRLLAKKQEANQIKLVSKMKNREDLSRKELKVLQDAKILVLKMIKGQQGMRAVQKFLRMRFKVFERLYLAYVVYMEADTLTKKYIPKELRLKKRELFQLKTVLQNTLEDVEEILNETCASYQLKNEAYFAHRHEAPARAAVHAFNSLSIQGSGFQQAEYRWQQDLQDLRTVIENGKFLFDGHPKRQESSLKVYKRSLRRNLDWIILSVLYESIQGSSLTNLVPHSYEKGFFFNRSPEAPIQASYETLLELYHKNFNLVTFLREQIINLVNPNVFSQGGDKSGRLKTIIKTKIGNLIEEICIKNPNLHPQLITSFMYKNSNSEFDCQQIRPVVFPRTTEARQINP